MGALKFLSIIHGGELNMLRRKHGLSKFTTFLAAALGSTLLVPNLAQAETTMAWTATGYVSVDVHNFPMADGSTQQNYVSKVIYTATDGDMAGQNYVGDCVGTGTVG